MNLLQQMIAAGKRWTGLGRRQKRQLNRVANNTPTEPLCVTYSNGSVIRYVPRRVEGIFLVCEAFVSTREVPKEISHGMMSITIHEFTEHSMQLLFRRYHESLMSSQALRWESDNKPVQSSELTG